MAENDKHLRQIKNLKNAANRSRRWAEKNEGTKIGFDPVKEPERNISTRSYIGAKTKKMQSRVTQYERRIENEIEEWSHKLNVQREFPGDPLVRTQSFHCSSSVQSWLGN